MPKRQCPRPQLPQRRKRRALPTAQAHHRLRQKNQRHTRPNRSPKPAAPRQPTICWNALRPSWLPKKPPRNRRKKPPPPQKTPPSRRQIAAITRKNQHLPTTSPTLTLPAPVQIKQPMPQQRQQRPALPQLPQIRLPWQAQRMHRRPIWLMPGKAWPQILPRPMRQQPPSQAPSRKHRRQQIHRLQKLHNPNKKLHQPHPPTAFCCWSKAKRLALIRCPSRPHRPLFCTHPARKPVCKILRLPRWPLRLFRLTAQPPPGTWLKHPRFYRHLLKRKPASPQKQTAILLPPHRHSPPMRPIQPMLPLPRRQIWPCNRQPHRQSNLTRQTARLHTTQTAARLPMC